MTTVTVVYEMRDEEDAQQLLELFKTRKVMEGTGSIVACCQGDAMQERDNLLAVERWDIACGDGGMYTDKATNGEWVKYADLLEANKKEPIGS